MSVQIDDNNLRIQWIQLQVNNRLCLKFSQEQVAMQKYMYHPYKDDSSIYFTYENFKQQEMTFGNQMTCPKY